MHEVKIKPVLNGFICKVGCQTVVFNNIDKMLVELEEYLKNPKEKEKDYMENSLNSGKLESDIIGCEPPRSYPYLKEPSNPFRHEQCNDRDID